MFRYGSRYKREFGFLLQNRSIVVDDVRVRAVGKTQFAKAQSSDGHGNGETAAKTPPAARQTAQIFFKDRHHESRVYVMEDLEPGQRMEGPAIIMDKLSTILVEPECHCDITAAGDARYFLFYQTRVSCSF